MLDFADYNHTVQATDAVYVAERVEHEVLIVLHVVGIHLDKEVIIARSVVALRDLVDALHPIHKLLYQVVGVLLEPDVAKRDDIVAHFARIYLRRIARDEPFALQTLLPFKRGRGRKMHPFGQFLDRQVGVLLQNAQHLDVDFVERKWCCHILFYLI